MKNDLYVISLLLIDYKPYCREEKKIIKQKGKPWINTLKLFHCKTTQALCRGNTSTLLELAYGNNCSGHFPWSTGLLSISEGKLRKLMTKDRFSAVLPKQKAVTQK